MNEFLIFYRLKAKIIVQLRQICDHHQVVQKQAFNKFDKFLNQQVRKRV